MRGFGRVLLLGLWASTAMFGLESTAFGQRAGAGSTQFVPVPIPMNGSFGMGGAAAEGSGGAPVNAFNNPYMTPMLYGSMYPMTQNQIGWMMLANQAQMTGIGSGRLSGVRPAGGSSTAAASARATASSGARRPTSGMPGGLATRYFNRKSPNTRYPRTYFHRGTGYFPDGSR